MAGFSIEKRKRGGKDGGDGRERLLQAAERLAQQSSFDGVTVDEIVKAADLSRPAFYYHFAGGKEELRAELIRLGALEETEVLDNRQAILGAALRVFARSGINAATLDEIAAEAHVSRGAVCWHYGGKDELLRAIIEQHTAYATLRSTMEQIEQELQDTDSLDEQMVLRRIAGGFYDAFIAQGDLPRLSVLLVHTHPEAARLLAQRIANGRKFITTYVQERQEAGVFRKDIDANLFVHMLAMTFVMSAIGRGLTELLPLEHLSREEAIEQVVSTLLYGITRKGEERERGHDNDG